MTDVTHRDLLTHLTRDPLTRCHLWPSTLRYITIFAVCSVTQRRNRFAVNRSRRVRFQSGRGHVRPLGKLFTLHTYVRDRQALSQLHQQQCGVTGLARDVPENNIFKARAKAVPLGVSRVSRVRNRVSVRARVYCLGYCLFTLVVLRRFLWGQ